MHAVLSVQQQRLQRLAAALKQGDVQPKFLQAWGAPAQPEREIRSLESRLAGWQAARLAGWFAGTREG